MAQLGLKNNIDIARNCNVIITMLGYPHNVEEIYLNNNGLVNNAGEGIYLLDMTTSSPLLAVNDFSPGFYIKHFIKDLKIAIGTAKQMNLATPALELALKLYNQLANKGEENNGTQALFKLYSNSKTK